MPQETLEQRKLVNSYLTQFTKSYDEIERDAIDGPIRFGKPLEMGEDVYSVAYVYQLKRVYLESDLSDQEEENKVRQRIQLRKSKSGPLM